MKHLRITVDGKIYDVQVESLDETTLTAPIAAAAPMASVSASVPAAPAVKPQAAPVPMAAEGDITSPLAGVVQAIEVKEGVSVKAGDLVITLEAMKMFTEVNAPGDGTVSKIYVNPGDSVDEGQPLFAMS